MKKTNKPASSKSLAEKNATAQTAKPIKKVVKAATTKKVTKAASKKAVAEPKAKAVSSAEKPSAPKRALPAKPKSTKERFTLLVTDVGAIAELKKLADAAGLKARRSDVITAAIRLLRESTKEVQQRLLAAVSKPKKN